MEKQPFALLVIKENRICWVTPFGMEEAVSFEDAARKLRFKIRYCVKEGLWKISIPSRNSTLRRAARTILGRHPTHNDTFYLATEAEIIANRFHRTPMLRLA